MAGWPNKSRVSSGRGWIENLSRDLGYGARALWKNPGFAASAVLTLAVGIGANTAIFSLVNALFFRPLPFRDPDRLVWISNPVSGGEGLPGLTRQATLRDWLKLNRSCESLGGYLGYSERMNYILSGHGGPVLLSGIAVSEKFIETLGVSLRLGRDFSAAECGRNGPKAVILAEAFWKRRFQADPGIIGKSITINDESWTVAGILPESFDFSSVFRPGARAVDFLRPYPQIPGDHWGNFWAVIGRLRPGVTPGQAQADFDLLNRQLQQANPARGAFAARLIPLRARVSGRFRRPFLVLCCAVGCVLLIACVNLANLLLSRAAARRREMAVRVALGAGRGRIARRMLAESAWLVLLGTALGMALACAATNLLAQSSAVSLPLLATVRVDLSALAFTLLAACFTALVFGVVPALQFSRAAVQNSLKEAGRICGLGRRDGRLGRMLVICEVGMASVLLVGAGLLIQSFLHLLDVDLGFRPEQVALWHITPNIDFATTKLETAYYKELAGRVASLPSVEAASMTGAAPLGLDDTVSLRAEGESYRPGQTPSASLREVDPGYFKTLRIPLLAGRDFNPWAAPEDIQSPSGREQLVVVNQRLAAGLWPGREAVGRKILIEDRSPPLICRVIGVVANVRQSAIEEEGGPEVYLPGWGRELIVRSKGTMEAMIPAVRGVLREINPNMPPAEVKRLEGMVDQARSPRRLVALLLGLFSFTALFLAAAGIHGVMACSVGRRTNEIGLRLALGSPPAAVRRLVLREGLRLVLTGGAAGLAAAAALTRTLRALLYGVSPMDPWVFLASAALLLGAALLACWVPAYKAGNVDPMTALRHE